MGFKSLNFLGDLITEAREKKGWSRQQLADATGYSLNAIADIEIGKVTRPGPKNRRLLADALGLSAEDIYNASKKAVIAKGRVRLPRSDENVLYADDDLPDDELAADEWIDPKRLLNSTRDRSIPVLGRAAGGANGEYLFNGSIIDYVECPPGLEDVPDAYAVYVDGESMSPRYKPGDTIWVHPGRAPRAGDDVVIQIEGATTRGFIKRFISSTSREIRLRQFNPDKYLTFPRGKVVSVHPVVFIRPA